MSSSPVSEGERDVGAVLAEIAVEAARLILPLWRSGLTVRAKADQSPVTEADQRAERLILDRLAKAFPGVPVISEEDAAQFGTPEAIASRFFLVDPLDGTKAFVRGDPHFTVNIGLIDGGRPVAGAVVAPPSGEVWFTRKGGAAKQRFADSVVAAIRTRPWPDGAAIALVSHTMTAETLATLTEAYGFSSSQAMDSSIKLCRIAEGAADIYPRQGTTMEWDTAAGHAVLQAAGGRLTTPEGAPFLYGKATAGFRNGGFVARGA
ncbi:MAG TPA: 3'(2'),5'-bisphosphate nucleotidase CysQ [Caulobacteraceae bacterium]|nr:3'(2'),5'-bisphosphate nucleotidase CysQ [Caulobacteraceae bacterium]